MSNIREKEINLLLLTQLPEQASGRPSRPSPRPKVLVGERHLGRHQKLGGGPRNVPEGCFLVHGCCFWEAENWSQVKSLMSGKD